MRSKRTICRRHFLQGVAAAVAVGQRSIPSSLWAQTPSSSREKLFLFNYSDVKLSGGPLRDQLAN
jgi:hypothetical protein